MDGRKKSLCKFEIGSVGADKGNTNCFLGNVHHLGSPGSFLNASFGMIVLTCARDSE